MAEAPGRLSDGDWLEERYVGERRSLREIAAEIGTAPNTVRGALLAHGIETRGRGPARKTSDEELLESLREAAETADGRLTTGDYKRGGEYSAQMCVERFGSWSSAKKRAGVE